MNKQTFQNELIIFIIIISIGLSIVFDAQCYKTLAITSMSSFAVKMC
jgi:hypothetical protein